MFLSTIRKWFSGRLQSSARRTTTALCVESLEQRETPAIDIVFNYSLDANGFFNDTSRRVILERAANLIESRLGDTLSAITPSGANTWKPNLANPATGLKYTLPGSTKIPANTVVVYAGGRNLSGDTRGIGGAGGWESSGNSTWRNTIKGRGEVGALASSPTDVAPWGGAIAFDTTLPPDVKWHFGLTTEGLDDNETDFLSVAMHELGHLLGLGSSKSWDRLSSSGSFTGSNAKATFGRNVPLDPDRAHFQDETKDIHGLEAAMDPSILRGTRKLFGVLDFAALKDIGWEVHTKDETVFQAATQLAKLQANIPGGLITESSITRNLSIGSAKDVDMYRVFVAAGVKLSVSVTKSSSGTPLDTYLSLFDTSGKRLKSANQGGKGGKDYFSYTSPRDDYFFIGISSVGNRTYTPLRADSGPGGATGSYRMTISLY